MKVNYDLQLKILAHASLAPNAHNTQPARWWFRDDGEIWLLCDKNRSLPAEDPTGFVNRMTLGVAFEALSIAMSRYNLALEKPNYEDNEFTALKNDKYKFITRTKVVSESAVIDPLYDFVERRHTFRGIFSEDLSSVDTEYLKSLPHILLTQDKNIINTCAELTAEATLSLMKIYEANKEFYQWTRLLHSNPKWNLDGMSADSLCLNGFERYGAIIGLNPLFFQMLSHIGLGKLFFSSQKHKNMTAPYIVTILYDKDKNQYEQGQWLYRSWLQLTKAGLYACPMSALSDYPPAADKFNTFINIPPDKVVVKILTAGPVKSLGKSAHRARLPAENYLLKNVHYE